MQWALSAWAGNQERRIGWNGRLYTKEDIEEYYWPRKDIWDDLPHCASSQQQMPTWMTRTAAEDTHGWTRTAAGHWHRTIDASQPDAIDASQPDASRAINVVAPTTDSTIDSSQLALGSPEQPRTAQSSIEQTTSAHSSQEQPRPAPRHTPPVNPTIAPEIVPEEIVPAEIVPAEVVATDLLSGATEHARQVLVAPAPALPGLQCPMCKRELCQAHSLCFFRRINPQGGVEVHLMLKPEAPVPPTFVRAPEAEKGATQTWQCACGAKIGDTRPIGPSKAAMTAFKSSSVMLHGQHHTAKKSMRPRIHDSPPFNDIEVRSRDSFHGI
jgi:hypothetical protein